VYDIHLAKIDTIAIPAKGVSFLRKEMEKDRHITYNVVLNIFRETAVCRGNTVSIT
jgi:hypothetical protein